MTRKAILVDVVERDFGDAQVGARQAADEQRDADAGAADDRRSSQCRPPVRVDARLRPLIPAARHCSGVLPFIHATRKPALKESPAPVVSTTLTFGAGTWMSRSGASHTAPCIAELDDGDRLALAPVGDRVLER